MSESILTAKRGRKPTEVTPVELHNFILALEAEQPTGQFRTRQELYLAVESSDWAKSRVPRPLKAQSAYMIVKNNNLQLRTPLGERGRKTGFGGVPGVKRPRKAIDAENVALVRATMPETQTKRVNRMAKGNPRAAIGLKCLDCTNNQRVEIAGCTIKECSLWSFRPYKTQTDIQREKQRVELVTV